MKNKEPRAPSSTIAAVLMSPTQKGEGTKKICLYVSDLRDLEQNVEYLAINGKMTPLKQPHHEATFDTIRVIKHTDEECQYEVAHYEWPIEEPTDTIGRIVRI